MRRATCLAIAACLTACARDDGADRAAAVFAQLQDALLAADEDRCRAALTIESTQALAEMPWERIRRNGPLQVLGARREQHHFRVLVADPAAAGRTSEFVVVRENGRLVVDLVATAGLHAVPVAATAAAGAAAPTEALLPRELSPADLDRIRQWELSQPRN